MASPVTILVIGKESPALTTVVDAAKERQHTVKVATTAGDALEIFRSDGAELVVTILPLDMGSAALLGRLRAQDPRVPIVVTGVDEDVAGAPHAIELGATEYLRDPEHDPARVLGVIGLALGARKTDAQLRYLRRKDAAGAAWETLVGQCPAMRRVVAVVKQICHRTASGGAPTILILGETGTGKGLLAKSVHYNSVRRSHAFVDINCAAIPAQLIEAELFGHERGAFTDARSSRPGLFETADGGTLFLDEISSLPLDLQAKLLSAIEEKRVRRIGARQPIQVDVQVIAATHRDLGAMVKQGQFRADLYHRLNVLGVELPALRERGEDKLLLAKTFVASLCQEYGIAPRTLADDAKDAIMRYSWPGNVRELRNQIERIILLEDDEFIRAHHFHFAAARDEVKIRSNGVGMSVSLPEGRCPLEEVEREILRLALKRCDGNVSRAARYLVISRQTLIYRMKKYALDAIGDTDEREDLPDEEPV